MILSPLYQAPMAGVTDKPFRKMVRLFSDHVLYTEMIGVGTLLRAHPVTQKMAQVADEKNLIAQLVGSDPDEIAKAAQIMEGFGVIGIDINMGCPVKKLISNCSGATLMKYPQKAAEIIEKTVASVKLPVSAKIRLGWDNTHKNAVEFAKILESAGASSITVHGRTKDQGYSGTADWDMIASVKQALSIPVIANGDIVDYESAVQVSHITHADGLMIGRGMLGKPWLLAEISTGQKPSYVLSDIVLTHLDALLSYYGPHGLYVARKHIAWYARGKKDVAAFCQKVYAEQNIQTVQKMIQDFFDTGEAK